MSISACSRWCTIAPKALLATICSGQPVCYLMAFEIFLFRDKNHRIFFDQHPSILAQCPVIIYIRFCFHVNNVNMSFDVFLLKLTHSPPPVSESQHNLSEAVTLLRQYVHHNHCSSQGMHQKSGNCNL